jgi:hypothetical protein
MSVRQRLGALAYDWPRFLRHVRGDWTRIRNRREVITTDGRGVTCHWEFGSTLHIGSVFPVAARWLMRRAFSDWPVRLRNEPAVAGRPAVTFLIGHRGRERTANLLMTLRSIAGQGLPAECIVIEQSPRPEIQCELPAWVRYLHTPVELGFPYCRSATFNAGAALARAEVLVLHDNDLLVPCDYALELLTRIADGAIFLDLKRFIFYLSEADTSKLSEGPLRTDLEARIVQNLRGGSVAATARGFAAIGGFDEAFVGWGGEDLDFWERAAAHGRTYVFGYLPMMHLWHTAQPRKADPDAPAVRRYYDIRHVPPQERIRRLRDLRSSS